MEKSNLKHDKWGIYSPPRRSIFLRALIKIGLGRGAVRAKILKQWKSKYGDIIDISVRGINYRLNINDNLTDAKIFASSVIYDKKELSFLQQCCQKGVFVDVGANTGYYSLSLAKSTDCQVLAIEANPPAIKRLQFNVDINENLKKRIRIIPVGVGAEGRQDIYSGGNLGGASFHRNLHGKPTDSIPIQTKPLYDIIMENNIQQLDALKIDIEGMEDRALVPFFENAPKDMWPACVVLEDDHQHMWETDLVQLMFAKGYIEASRTQGNNLLKLQAT